MSSTRPAESLEEKARPTGRRRSLGRVVVPAPGKKPRAGVYGGTKGRVV